MTKLADSPGRWVDQETGEIVTLVDKTWTLTVSGGLLQTRVTGGLGRSLPIDHGDDDLIDGDNLDWGDVADFDQETAGVVEVFSRKSRMRCRAAGASVDWHAAYREGHRLAMVTLTYPDDWRSACPSPSELLRQRKALEKRYQRASGNKMEFIWKREFQERGAPHVHMFGWWPFRVGGTPSTTWFSFNWYEVVASGDPNHLLAGTGMDYREAFKMSDPNRVGNYFASYLAKGKYKDYQNVAPDGWRNPNGSVGRYWGIVGLERLRVDVEITRDNMVKLQRLLRGYLGSQKRTERTRSSRNGARDDGNRRRYVNRRYKLRSLKGDLTGFTFLTNDGAALALTIARALQLDDRQSWPKGQPRPLP